MLVRYIKLLVLIVFFLTFFLSCRQSNPLFTSVSSSTTNINFTNKVEERDLFNILYYLYFYNGGGVATGDINNDGLTDLYFTANSKGGNKLYLNKGNFKFEDITEKATVAGTADWCSGVTMADVNADGFLDIYVSAASQHHGLKGHNELFINNGNGTFTESADKYALNFSGFGTQAAFFDYDHDGDLDCYLLNHSQKPNANIADTSNRRKMDSLSGDRFYRNDFNTAGRFTDVSAQAGIYQSSLGYGLGIAIADINNDGWDDIYIGNDFHENDYYYINNGNGTFTESGAKHFRHYSRFSMGNDIADYNNDGQPDVVTVDMLPPDEKTLKTYGSDENLDTYKFKLMGHGYQNQFSKNCLQRNNGNGISFSETGLQSGISATDWSWSPLFADFDNDGNKDLFISSGIVKRPVDLDYVRFVSDLVMKMDIDKTNAFDKMAIDKMPDGASHPFLFKGDGTISFKDMSDEWGTAKMKGYFNGAAYADLDNDGNLDLIMNCLNAKAVILKNNTKNKNSLTISFKGDSLNRFGIGAKVYVFQKNKLQYQQLMLTRGFQSSTDTRLHFGLDSVTVADSLLVVWPDQKFQVIKNVSTTKPVHFSQKEATGIFNYTTYFKTAAPVFTDISKNILCNWEHRENDFVDFNVQYLIPHVQSTRGPKLAVADVNGDGLDDFYACGATNQSGVLMIQQKNGSFLATDTAVFNADAICEDVDAVFFDANGDKSPDLLVVSGGNQIPQQSSALEDRLYLNNTKGHFIKAEHAFTKQYENKSCVAVADIDHDGDEDFFIGNFVSPTGYGILKNSFLYLNDGKANFTLANLSTIDLNKAGMITSASFADVNKDGWPDLIVTGEWMSIKIFMNNKGIFKAIDIPASTGLWQTISVTDVNGDGFVDILAGNWGHNSKLWERKSGPLKLYQKDFDNNGSNEQIMTYTMNGKEYTFLAKDELERQLPLLKKAYLTYGEVAGKTVDYVFYDLFKDYQEFKAETLSSSCFINDGKGNFKLIELPEELQMAPIMSFAMFSIKNEPSWIAAGNFYGVIPYEGRYDALQPSMFTFNKSNNEIKATSIIPDFDGEVRDIKWLKTINGKKIMVIAKNNGKPIFLQQNIE